MPRLATVFLVESGVGLPWYQKFAFAQKHHVQPLGFARGSGLQCLAWRRCTRQCPY